MMNSPYETLVSPEIVERLGWLLVHSLWQFALIGMAAFVFERAMRRYSAGARYSLLMAAMLLIVFAPIYTWCLLPERAGGLAAARVEYPNPQFRLSEIADPKQAATHSSATASAADSLATPISNEDVLHAATAMPETSVRQWWSRLNAVLSPWLTAIVVVWSAGVLVFSVRLLLSWFTVRRLRTVGVVVVDDAVRQATVRITQRLGLRRRAHVLQSTLVNAPIVVGCFRSVILLPPSLLSGLPMSQLEAILAHELAHVRRYDYVVNLGQTLIETLFFYHPAVWWLSNRIRIERENCCDDLVVEALGDRVRYGRALLAIEEYRGSALALSARGGSLLSRVRRLWQIEKPDRSRPAGIVAGLSFLCLFVTMLALWLVVLGSEPASVAEESQAERDSAAELAAWDALDLMPITVYGPAAQRQSLRQQIRNMEQANFPENAIRSFRQQLQQPVRSAEFWNVPADAWIQIGRLASLEELRIVASDLRGKPTEEIGRLASCAGSRLSTRNVTRRTCLRWTGWPCWNTWMSCSRFSTRVRRGEKSNLASLPQTNSR